MLEHAMVIMLEHDYIEPSLYGRMNLGCVWFRVKIEWNRVIPNLGAGSSLRVTTVFVWLKG
jgi:hypothetical protein